MRVVLELVKLAGCASITEYRTVSSDAPDPSGKDGNNKEGHAQSVLAMNWKTRPLCEAGAMAREWSWPSAERVTSMPNLASLMILRISSILVVCIVHSVSDSLRERSASSPARGEDEQAGKEGKTHFSLGAASDMAFAVYGSLGAMVGEDVEKQKRWGLLRRIGATTAVRARASAGRSLRVASIGRWCLQNVW